MKNVIAASLLAVLMAAGASAGDPPGKKPGGKGAPGAGKGGGMMMAKLFEKGDANNDGKISLEEFRRAAESAPGGKLKDNAEKIFKRLDANGDGFVTKDEFKKAQEQMQARRPGAGEGQKKPG